MSTSGTTRFVIVSTQRSGSTWLVDVLNRIDNTVVYGELFLRQKRVWDAGALDYPRYVDLDRSQHSWVRPFSVFAYLDGLYDRPGAVGFKLMYSHLRHYPEVIAYLWRHRVNVVHLVRRNYFNIIISREMVQARGQAHLVGDRTQMETPQLHFEPSRLIREMQWMERRLNIMRGLLKSLRLPTYEVAYEDLVADTAYFEKIRRLLGLDTNSTVPQSALHKITDRCHADLISNYQEVKQALAPTVFATLID